MIVSISSYLYRVTLYDLMSLTFSPHVLDFPWSPSPCAIFFYLTFSRLFTITHADFLRSSLLWILNVLIWILTLDLSITYAPRNAVDMFH